MNVLRVRWQPWSLSAVLFLAALAFLLAFHRYNLWDMTEGWIISDEGHQLYQPLRWMAGQWHYRDFATDNYPPGMPFLHATLFRLFGVRMSVIRAFLAVVGAGIATLAFIIARRLMPAGWAMLAFLFCLTWNVFNLNIGFPSWYCVVLGLAAVGAVLCYARDGRLFWLVFAGALSGISMAFKLTQGVYTWLGIGLFLAWQSVVSRPAKKSRFLCWESIYALALVMAAIVLLRGYSTPVNWVVFGVPIALASAGAIGAAALPRMNSCPRAGCRPFLRELLWMGLGAALVTAVWALPTIVVVGWPLFWESTFLAPLRHSAFMHAAIRPPTLNGWLLLAWAAGGVIGLWRTRQVRAGWALAYGIVGGILLVVPWGADFNPREALRAAYQTWRELRFYLPIIVCLAGWALLWRRRVSSAQQGPLVLLLVWGAWNMLQVFPFADSNHLLWSIQPAFIVLAYLFYRAWEALRGKMALMPASNRSANRLAGLWVSQSAIAAVAVGLVPALGILMQLYPLVGHFYQFDGGQIRRLQYELLAPPRADVYVEERHARTLRQTNQAILALTKEGDTIFDTSGSFFYFLSGRHNPTKHDFLWPGFLTDEEIAGLVADLEARRPALVIRRETDEHVQGYASFRSYFPAVAAFIERNYVLGWSEGVYSLWRLKGEGTP